MAKMFYKVAIIVPVFNTGDLLFQCIDSILNQTFKDYLLILVDDGSTDKSGHICDKYASNNNNIIALHKANGGQGAARNHALDYVYDNYDFDYISFIDSDDWVEPQYLEVLLKKIDNSDIVMCGFNKFANNHFENVFATSNDLIVDENKFWRLNNSETIKVVLWNKLYKSNIFQTIRFPEIRFCEDGFVIHHVIGAARTISVINDLLYCYRIRNDSTMGKLNNKSVDFLLVQLDSKKDKFLYFYEKKDNELFAYHYDRFVLLIGELDVTCKGKSKSYRKDAAKFYLKRKHTHIKISSKIFLILYFKPFYLLLKKRG